MHANGPLREYVLQSEQLSQNWSESLSYSDLVSVHLASALALNPQVLVMHRPSIHFETSEGRQRVVVVRVRVRDFCEVSE